MMVPGGGFEPPTRRFSVVCSTPELPRHSQAARRNCLARGQGKRAYGEAAHAWQDLNSVFGGNIFRRGGRAGHGIAIAKPLRQVAIAAAAGTEGAEFLCTRFLANGAGSVGHRATIWACGEKSATSSRASITSSRPVRRRSSSSHWRRSSGSSAGLTSSSN